jgi:hypothetical protein
VVNGSPHPHWLELLGYARFARNWGGVGSRPPQEFLAGGRATPRAGYPKKGLRAFSANPFRIML